MSLSNEQHASIMRQYDEIQLRHARELDARRREAYAALPRLAELDTEAASLAMKKAHVLIEKSGGQDFDLAASLDALQEERAALLGAHGFPADFLELSYDCPHCHDTGYSNGKKCACFRQKEIALLYSQSNLQGLSETGNFSDFSLMYYSENGSPSPREKAVRALEAAKSYVSSFGTPENPRNLCFYGNVGTGKTFLTNCIARELIEKGCSVLYQPSYELFEALGKYTFSSDKEMKEAHDSIFSCDLLIIDDLGTELTNAFTASQLFLIMNERELQKKATILSTNIPPENFENTFSERISSRLLGFYKLIPLSGTDIRILKRLKAN